jgi:WD40 repeat protein
MIATVLMTARLNSDINYKELHTLEGQTLLLVVSVQSGGEILASASYDGTVKLWSLKKQRGYCIC